MKYLSAALFLAISSPAFAQAKAVISGPEKANPGDLVILSADESYADDLHWVLVNSDKTFLPVEDDRKCVFASGQPGRYIFVLAASKASESVGSTVDLAKHCVQIGEPAPPPPPEPPSPPEPPPAPDLTGIAKTAYEAVAAIEATPEEIAAVSRNLKTIAGKAAGLSWTLDQIKKEYATVSRETVFTSEEIKTRWTPFAKVFVATMKEQATPSAAIEAFSEMASGLDVFLTRGVSTADPINASLKTTVESLRGTVDGLKQDVTTIRKEIGS